MRKALEVVSLLGLLVLAWLSQDALSGRHRLPSRIPTHFGVNGQPDAWGSPWMLLALPIGAGALYVLMTLVSLYPGAFNFPVRVTPSNRARLEDLALKMIAWLKAEVIWLFVFVQMAAIKAARSGGGSGASRWLMPVALGVVLGTILGYVVAMRRSQGPDDLRQLRMPRG